MGKRIFTVESKARPLSKEALKLKLKVLRKRIFDTFHSLNRKVQRDYNELDIELLTQKGTLRKIDRGFSKKLGKMTFCYTLHCKDRFGEWAFIILADEGATFRIVTIGPATDPRLFGDKVVGI